MEEKNEKEIKQVLEQFKNDEINENVCKDNCENDQNDNLKTNKKLFIRILEILIAICMGGTGCRFLLMLLSLNNVYMFEVLLVVLLVALPAITLITMSFGLIVGLEKGKKTVKTICIIMGIIGSLISMSFWVMVYTTSFVAKPIIYLYPEEETEVSVELGKSESITVSYPKYEHGWNVIAKTDGTLIDLNTNRQLYSLYYENASNIKFEVTNEGFVVKREDVAQFLEEKLEILGLTEKESEEFIIYWLPILQENEYNYIRFATAEEIEENMPLEITPTPDTTIRVLMTYKGLKKEIEVEEQKLETPERTGFVAVEWGGTEIK